MINKYIAKMVVEAHYTYEDPKCPSNWRGSGCYDIDVPCKRDVDVEVWSNSYAEAEKLLLAYDYAIDYCVTIDDAWIKEIRFEKEMADRGEDEACVIEPINIRWDE